jgi:mannose-6-phosphate isomerase-like protein (cupin superfamily)
MHNIVIKSGQTVVIESTSFDLYQYRAYIGTHQISTDIHSSYWMLDQDEVVCRSGTGGITESTKLCVEIFGYTPEKRTSTFSRLTDLPYINGCSTKQLIPPNRLGDPTWQMLHMPPFTSEQARHIHSTTRIVYVHSGRGWSHLGQEKLKLEPGDVIVLDKMIPHHFSTEDESLTVLPLHVFSSTTEEFDHPMFNGTHKI